MNYFKTMRMTTMVYWLAAILLAALSLTAFFSYLAVERYSQANTVNKKLLLGKEFEGDITNPAFGLWTPIRLAAFVSAGANSSEMNEYKAEYLAFKLRYRDRLDWAKSNLSNPEVRRMLLEDFSNSMDTFFTLWETQFWPAVQAGKTDDISRIFNGPLMDAYKANKLINKRIADKQTEVQNVRVKEFALDEKSAFDAGNVSFWLSLSFTIIGLLLSLWIAKVIYSRLQKMVDNLSKISQEISGQIDSQGSSVSQLSTSVHETTTSMDELNASFQHTESLAGESSGQAKNALKHSDQGNALTVEMLEGLTLHKEKVAAIVDQIARLSEITHQIHNVAAATSNLTNQTNILALNAAVQSAHVKQQTEGFSVIASEIRKLADESKKFLSHIDVLAENIKHATDVTMTLAEDGQKTLQECIKLAQSVSKSFGSINAINNGSSEVAEQVVMNVKQQVHAVHQVLGAMEIVNNVSQETLAGMAQVRAELDKLNLASTSLKALV